MQRRDVSVQPHYNRGFPHPTGHCSSSPHHHLPYLHPGPHCSPKFGLYRFFNIFLQNPYLLTWQIWGGGNIRTLPIFQHFSSDFLSFNMADLGRHFSHIHTTLVVSNESISCHEFASQLGLAVFLYAKNTQNYRECRSPARMFI